MKNTHNLCILLILLFCLSSYAVAQTEEYEDVTVTFDFNSTSDVYGMKRGGSNDYNTDPTVFKVDDIIVTVEGTTCLYGKNNNSKHYLRLDYKTNSSSSIGEISFALPENCILSEIKFNTEKCIYLLDSKNKDITIAKQGVYTWTPATKSVSPFTFTVNDKKSNTNGDNTYLSSIQISYKRPKINVVLKEKDSSIKNLINESIGQTDVGIERVFHNAGKNTLCLPFDITLDALKEIFGNNTEAAVYTGSDDENINFSSILNGTINAGLPFILIPELYVENPTIHDIYLKSDQPQEVRFGNISFCGTYEPYKMKTDGTEYFLNSEQKLARPTEIGNTMRGLRAFFRFYNENSDARSILFDGETSGLSLVRKNQCPTNNMIYTIDGKRISNNRFNKSGNLFISAGKKYINK